MKQSSLYEMETGGRLDRLLESCGVAVITSGDKREKPRHDIERQARIELDDGSRFSCLLQDVSQSGACLKVNDATALPDSFKLWLSDTLQRWTEIVWRGSDRVGIRFVGITKPTPATCAVDNFKLRPYLKLLLGAYARHEVALQSVEIAAGTSSEPRRHGGDHWLVVQEGEVLCTMEQQQQLLRSGESIHIRPELVYSLQNSSDQLARIMELTITEMRRANRRRS